MLRFGCASLFQKQKSHLYAAIALLTLLAICLVTHANDFKDRFNSTPSSSLVAMQITSPTIDWCISYYYNSEFCSQAMLSKVQAKQTLYTSTVARSPISGQHVNNLTNLESKQNRQDIEAILLNIESLLAADLPKEPSLHAIATQLDFIKNLLQSRPDALLELLEHILVMSSTDESTKIAASRLLMGVFKSLSNLTIENGLQDILINQDLTNNEAAISIFVNLANSQDRRLQSDVVSSELNRLFVYADLSEELKLQAISAIEVNKLTDAELALIKRKLLNYASSNQNNNELYLAQFLRLSKNIQARELNSLFNSSLSEPVKAMLLDAIEDKVFQIDQEFILTLERIAQREDSLLGLKARMILKDV